MLCSEFVFFGFMKYQYKQNIMEYQYKHENLVISLDISPQVIKADFFVARATSKTFKCFACTVYKSPFARRTPYTFTDNPIMQIVAKYSNKNSHYYGLSLLWTLSHGLEIVRLERVVLSFKDLEAGRSRLM